MPGSIDWVTFDCYGTLIDWERGIADALAPFLPAPLDRAARAALAARYIAVEAEVERDAYHPYREVLAHASARLLDEMGRPFPVGHEATLPASLPLWRPFPEAPGALRALAAAGFRLAILSNVDRDLLARSIERLGVAPDLVVTAEDCRSYKPAPGHWGRFLAESGAVPARVLHVGASVYHDVEPATRLGFRTVLVDRGGGSVEDAGAGGAHAGPGVEERARPTRVVPDLAALPDVVRQLADAAAGGPR